MPEFKAEEAARQTRKEEELAPYVEAALARKQWMEPLTDAEIPTYPAYGAMVAKSTSRSSTIRRRTDA